MKNLFSKIWGWVVGIFHKAENELQQALPLVVSFLSKIQTYDDTLGTPLSQLLGGVAIPLQAGFKKVLAIILNKVQTGVTLVDSSTEDEFNAALLSLINNYKLASGDEYNKGKFLTNLGADLVYELSNKTITFANAAITLEYWFKNYGTVANPTSTQDAEQTAENANPVVTAAAAAISNIVSTNGQPVQLSDTQKIQAMIVEIGKLTPTDTGYSDLANSIVTLRGASDVVLTTAENDIVSNLKLFLSQKKS